MAQFSFGKTPEGQPVMQVAHAEMVEPLKLLRAMKQAFPELWQQVHLEIGVPQNGKRLLVEGHNAHP